MQSQFNASSNKTQIRKQAVGIANSMEMENSGGNAFD